MTRETSFAAASRQLKRVYGKNATLHRSDRPTKKYYVVNPEGKRVYFGATGYADYTGHRDEERRRRFRLRNAAWATAPKWSPAHLAYHVLW